MEKRKTNKDSFRYSFVELKKKRHIFLAWLIRIAFIVSAVWSAVRGEYTLCFIALASLLLTLIPAFLSRTLHVILPPSYQIILLVFIFCAQLLGELRDYYFRFWWWDILLHTSSGVLLGYVGFLLIYVLNEASKVRMAMSPVFMALVSFIFAMACGALWEIFEYAMDQLFGFNMQKSGLHDTMWDLIVDMIGALIASISGYIHIHFKKGRSFERMIEDFLEANPRFYGKV